MYNTFFEQKSRTESILRIIQTTLHKLLYSFENTIKIENLSETDLLSHFTPSTIWYLL